MFTSLDEICKNEIEKDLPFWKVCQLDDCQETGKTEVDSFNEMKAMYLAMKESVLSYNPKQYSSSGLVGTEGEKLRLLKEKGDLLSGDFIGEIMEKALKVSENNACMKRIVAAPTAGSCGVAPAVLISVQERFGYTDEKMTEAVFVAAGIGDIIAKRAFIAGASGGCQAEIGAASAMAAGALMYLRGGNGPEICNAAGIALKNLLGLACDPVAGLVEVPCVKRNVLGAVNAVTSVDLTVAGIFSKIPPDEIIDAMKNIGKNMSSAIKETGLGGLAVSPTAKGIVEKISI